MSGYKMTTIITMIMMLVTLMMMMVLVLPEMVLMAMTTQMWTH